MMSARRVLYCTPCLSSTWPTHRSHIPPNLGAVLLPCVMLVALVFPLSLDKIGLVGFLGTSMLEEVADKKYGHRPGYHEHKRNTPCFVPRLW